MIVLVGSEKGGTGKTTCATTLAAMRRRRGRDVLLIDADIQGTSHRWAQERPADAPRVVCAIQHGRSFRDDVQDLAGRYDDVVIDAGGRDSAELRAALTLADRAIVPVQPAAADVWTLERMEELVSLASEYNPRLRASVVLTRASTNPHVPETEEAAAMLEEFEALAFSGVVLYDRAAYRRALGLGLAAEEMSAPDAKAVSETEALYAYAFQE